MLVLTLNLPVPMKFKNLKYYILYTFSSKSNIICFVYEKKPFNYWNRDTVTIAKFVIIIKLIKNDVNS